MQKKSHLNKLESSSSNDSIQLPGPLLRRKSNKQVYAYKFLGSPSKVKEKIKKDPFFHEKVKATIEHSSYILHEIFDSQNQDEAHNQIIHLDNSFTISDLRKRRHKSQKNKNFNYSIFLKTMDNNQ